LFENVALLRKILTWGRESSRQLQDMASKVGGGEQQPSCSSETFLQLQRYEMTRFREEGTTHCIFTCKTSSYSQTTKRKPLKPGHMLHEAYYYVVTVSAAGCNAQHSFKTTRLKNFGSHPVFKCR